MNNLFVLVLFSLVLGWYKITCNVEIGLKKEILYFGLAVQFSECNNHYDGCGKRNNEPLYFISLQSMGGNHEGFQSNHSSHPSLIKFSAVSTDLRRKKDTACLVCRHLESFKQYCRWEDSHKCILFVRISLQI